MATLACASSVYVDRVVVITDTTLVYSDLTATRTSISLTVANTGSIPGAEVVQLYLGFPAAAGEPPRQLKGFTKVMLAAGATATVTLPLTAKDLSTYEITTHSWQPAKCGFRLSMFLAPFSHVLALFWLFLALIFGVTWVRSARRGQFDVFVGASSRDIRLTGSFTSVSKPYCVYLVLKSQSKPPGRPVVRVRFDSVSVESGSRRVEKRGRRCGTLVPRTGAGIDRSSALRSQNAISSSITFQPSHGLS